MGRSSDWCGEQWQERGNLNLSTEPNKPIEILFIIFHVAFDTHLLACVS